MQRLTTSTYVVLPLLALFIIMLLYRPPIAHQVIAASPSFDLQQIADPINDWFFANNARDNYPNEAKNISDCKVWNSAKEVYDFPSPDISGVGYISDGKTLNATLWLSKPFVEPTSDRSPERLQISVITFPFQNIRQELNQTISTYKNFKAFRLIQSVTNATLAGHPAYKLVFTNTNPEHGTTKVMQLGTMIGHKTYLIQYFGGQPGKYSDHMSTVQNMIDSFKIETSGSTIPSKVNETQHFLTYQNSTYQISMNYPFSWLKEAGHGGSDRYVNQVVTFLPSPTWLGKYYIMSIDVISIYDVTLDYIVKIKWNEETQTWTRTVEQVSSTGNTKVLDTKDNVTTFFNKGQSYVNFSLDLGLLNYPNQYKLIFSTTDISRVNGQICHLFDFTNQVAVPPPEFNITTSSGSLFLRPGDQKDIELKITSNTNLNANISLSTKKIGGIKLNFIPNQTSVPSFGIATPILQVEALENATAQPYTFPVYGLVTFSPQATRSTGGSFNNPRTVDIHKQSFFTITVLPPEYNITASPTSLEARPGDEKDVQIQLISNTNLNSHVFLYAKQFDPLKVKFIPNETYVPPLGLVTSTLHIIVPKNGTAHPYTFPILSNFSILESSTYRKIGRSFDSTGIPITKSLAFTITILDPLSWKEQISDTWNKVGAPITFIYGIIAVIIPWFVNEIRKKRKKSKHKKISDC